MYSTTNIVSHLLKTIKPFAKLASGNKEINCRCLYCGDSKTQTKGHMYISTGYNDNPIYFYCQKCHTRGLLTSQILLEWGIFDADIAIELTEYHKKVLKLSKNTKFVSSPTYHVKNVINNIDKLTEYKLAYVNQRIGCNLTYEDCMRLKICLNLTDLLHTNNLNATRNINIVNQLDSGFMGFISIDNTVLNMRNLDIVKDLYEGINRRYINYNIIDKFDNTKRFYAIPNKIDISDFSSPIHLHIAEGPFDILSIYCNLRRDNDRNIYSSVGGSNYLGVLRYFIQLLSFPFLIIHLYPDNDISDNTLNYIYKYLAPFRYKVYEHRNLSPYEKDFGVPLNRIQEQVIQIL